MGDDQPAIDFLILADRAEALNGKLYMMGAGWDILAPPSATEPMHFSLALGILVPWLATNADQRCQVRIEDADGARLLDLAFSFRTGRPPALDQGATQRVMVAAPISLIFPASGAYAATATIGEDEKRVSFAVHLPAPQPR